MGCPACNGVERLSLSCPHCRGDLQDEGKLEDYFDDYSPYRQMDDLRRTNGFADLERRQCLHVVQCKSCGVDQVAAVPEVVLP